MEKSAPQMFEHMKNSGFVVRHSEKVFNCVPTDQALEQSINKDAKSKGGVIGYTLKKGALLRWLLTSHVIVDHAEKFKEMYPTNKQLKLHVELRKAGIKHDQQDVKKKIKDYIINQCQIHLILKRYPLNCPT